MMGDNFNDNDNVENDTTGTAMADMTNKELKVILEDTYGIYNKYPIARNPKQPTKAELILLLEELELFQGDLIAVVNKYTKLDAEKNQNTDESNIKLPSAIKKLTRQQQIVKKRKYLNALVRCIITKKHTKQSFDNGSKVVEYVTWGNRLIGFTTSRIVYDEIMHVHRGAIQNLEAVPATISKVDPVSGHMFTQVGKAYHVEILPPLTAEEIDEITERQKYYDSRN